MVDSKVLFNDKDIGWIEKVEQYRQSVKEYKKSFKELNIIMIKHVKYDLLKSQCFLRRLFLNDDSQIEIKLPDELAAIGISSIVYSGKDLNRVVVYYTAKTLMVDYSVVLKTLDDYIASHKNKVDEYLYLDIKFRLCHRKWLMGSNCMKQ